MRNVGITVNRGRGATPDEIAHRAVQKLMVVATGAPPDVKEQAVEFRNKIENLIRHAAKEAAYNDRVTVYNMIKDAGHPDLANLILKG